MVNGILDMSKIENGMFDISVEPISVAPLVEGCCEMMAHQAAERGVSLVRSVARTCRAFGRSPRVPPDGAQSPFQRHQVHRPRGTVRDEARVEDAMLAISVSDDGIGISADDIPRIGTPFVQVDSTYDRRFEGTGPRALHRQGLGRAARGSPLDQQRGRCRHDRHGHSSACRGGEPWRRG